MSKSKATKPRKPSKGPRTALHLNRVTHPSFNNRRNELNLPHYIVILRGEIKYKDLSSI